MGDGRSHLKSAVDLGVASYNRPMEFRLDRSAFSVTTFAEAAASHRELAYWLSRPASERLAAVEFLRRQIIDPGARLQRVLRVVDRARR